MKNELFRLYHYWRSSSSWRVRWALQIKGISCEFVTINLLTDEVENATHRERNPLGYIPVLEWLSPTQSKNRFLAESMAIIEYLEETYPEPSILPGDAFQRARIRQLAEIINSGTQPLQNPNVALFHSQDSHEQKRWNQHWISAGLAAYEKVARQTAGKFSVGDTVTLADLFLVPQCYNALRNEIDLTQFPTLEKIYQQSLLNEACKASAPDQFKPEGV